MYPTTSRSGDSITTPMRSRCRSCSRISSSGHGSLQAASAIRISSISLRINHRILGSITPFPVPKSSEPSLPPVPVHSRPRSASLRRSRPSPVRRSAGNHSVAPGCHRRSVRRVIARVMLAIVDFLRPDLYRWPSYEYLAFIAGMSEATVRRTVTALSERGLLVADEKSDGQVTLRIDGLIEKITSLTDDAT